MLFARVAFGSRISEPAPTMIAVSEIVPPTITSALPPLLFISNIGSSVKGYDTSCEDGFDFASAKSAIANNIEACTIKIENAKAPQKSHGSR